MKEFNLIKSVQLLVEKSHILKIIIIVLGMLLLTVFIVTIILPT